MMKRLIVLTVVMLAVLATAASATLDTAWQVKIWATDLQGSSGSSQCIYGTGTTASGSSTYNDTNMNVYITGTKASPKFRWIQASAPASTTIEWNLTIDAGPSYVPTKMKLQLWNESTSATTDLDSNWVTDPANAFKVTLYQGTEALYTFDPTKNGTSLQPMWTKEYDWVAGHTDTTFKLRREPVPEPGSMLALLSGVVGLAGFAVRRRR